MERFYNSDDQDEEKDPYYGSEREDEAEAEAEVIGYMDQTGILDVMHMDLAQDLAKNKLNQQLLTQTLEIAKSNWFWSFKSTIKKIFDLCQLNKIACGIHIVDPDPNILKNRIHEGFQFLAYSIDSVFLTKSSQLPI